MDPPSAKVNDQVNKASIPSNYSRLLGRMLGLKISDLHLLLAHTGLSKADFLDESTLLTAQQQMHVMKNIQRLSGDEAVGLAVGKQLTPHTHGTMGMLMINSPSVATCIRSMQDYIPTRFWFVKISDEPYKEGIEYTISFEYVMDEKTYRACADTAMTVFFETIKLVLGRHPEEIEVSFNYPEPESLEPYKDLFSGPLNFDESSLSLKIPRWLLQERNILGDSESYTLALKQCQQLLERINPESPRFKDKVQKILLSKASGSITVDDAAAALFMSRRTLARKLLSEGTTFKQVKEDIVSEQAANYLRETQLSTEAIAATLGYHDSSSFRRSFKRWHQLTPSQYRDQCQRGQC